MALLSSEFVMNDLGPLRYFLGIAMTRHAEGLFLSQSIHVSDIIALESMTSCKPEILALITHANTTISTTHKVKADVTTSRNRPDISR